MNRGIARRSIFDSDADRRLFLALLAAEVRRGRIEIHSFSLLTNHFHLLLSSPKGELSRSLQWINGMFARRFNKDRGRDGALFRSRFVSKLVETPFYRRTLVRYIDDNPEAAGLTDDAANYEFCSAFHWQSEHPAPWLSRSWIPDELAFWMTDSCPRPEAYRAVFGKPLRDDERSLVESSLHTTRRGKRRSARTDRRSDLPAWIRERAILADGAFLPALRHSPGEIVTALEQAASIDFIIGRGKRKNYASTLLGTALMRDLAKLTWSEIANWSGASLSSTQRRYARHARALDNTPDYANLCRATIAWLVKTGKS